MSTADMHEATVGWHSILPAKRLRFWRCGTYSFVDWLILSRNWGTGSPWLRQEDGKRPWGLPPVSSPEGIPRLGTS